MHREEQESVGKVIETSLWDQEHENRKKKKEPTC